MKGIQWLLKVSIVLIITFIAFGGQGKAQNRTGGEVSKTSSQKLLPPNELGQVMILEYHLIGYPESDWRRTPENFRKDLNTLYQEGYYPITLRELVRRTFNVPKGKTPVVITFDDSSGGQFRVIPEGKKWRVDPNSAVGIMMDFHKKHPDFPAKATFFVLPAIPTGLRLFAQEEYIKEKLEFLRDNGFEIGNHSYWHQNLGKASPEMVQKQMALAQKSIQEYLPGYTMTSLALPFGVWPKDRNLVYSGTYQGVSYRNEAIVLVGSGPVPSPYSKSFNPLALERIQAGDTPWGPGAYIRKFQKNPEERFVSDGVKDQITIPADLQSKLMNKTGKYRILAVERS